MEGKQTISYAANKKNSEKLNYGFDISAWPIQNVKNLKKIEASILHI
jgi:hypothetical protein